MKKLALAFSAILLWSACTSEDDDENDTGAVAGTLQLNFQSVQAEDDDSSGIVQDSNAPFRNYSIASGKPDEFNIDIVRIVLNIDESTGTNGSTPIFDDTEGKTLAIKKSRIDLSDMFTTFSCVDNNGLVFDLDAWYTDVFPTIDNTNDDGEVNEYRNWSSAADASCECGFDADNYPMGPNASGACPSLDADGGKGGQVADVSVDATTYSSVTVYYKRRATIKGCVTGYFFETWGQETDTVEESTFCTQSDLAMYDGTGGGDYTAFENQTAELTDFDLAGPNGQTESSFPGSASDLDPSEVIRIEFPIPEVFKSMPILRLV